MIKMNRSSIAKGILSASLLLGASTFLTTEHASANASNSSSLVVQSVSTSPAYNDLDSSQYWAKNMEWMVQGGYITGYINQKHPSTGKLGSWLNPGGQLTEAQMLSILLRYQLGVQGYEQMKKDIPNPQGSSTYNHYVKAKEIGMMTMGSTTESSYTYQQVSRGQLAKALVSMYYGKDVTLNEAVQFMFDNKITSGVDSSKGATLENFAPNTKLSRAHISTFLKNYHEVIESGNVIDPVVNKNTKDTNIFTLIPKAQKTADVTGSTIKTKFGERAYGTKNQTEYNALMKIIESESVLIKNKFESNKSSSYYLTIVKAYLLKDAKPTDPVYKDATDYSFFETAADEYSLFKGKIKTEEEITKIYSLYQLESWPEKFGESHSYDPFTGKWSGPVYGESAYDLVVGGSYNDLSAAYFHNAMFDQLGIDSFVLETPKRETKALTVVKLYDDWYVYNDEDAVIKKLTQNFIVSGDKISYAPNSGIDSLPTYLQSLYKPKN
ncbi:hypothetical protein UACE39S_05402 [Ureibacillus acetophenoni]